MDQLTAAQARVLDAIRFRVDSGGPPPTYRELQADLGFHSTASVRDHLHALARKGFVSLGQGRFRSVRLLRDLAPAVRIPLLGYVIESAPTMEQEGIEGSVAIPTQWIGGDYFAVRVVDDGMNGAGILAGDIAVLRRDLEPRNGQVVCVTVDGRTTLKAFEFKRNNAWLVPANSSYPAIRVTGDTPVHGVLQICIRACSSQSIVDSVLTAVRAPSVDHRCQTSVQKIADPSRPRKRDRT